MFNRKWMIIAISSFIFLLSVSIFAYLRLIPTEIKSFPYYDSVGHFLLFGCLGFFTHLALKRRRALSFGFLLPIGPILVASYAMIDETLQVFSTTRSFDLSDLGFG